VPKNIVLLSDGTGNSAAKLFKTNVFRLYEALDRSDPTLQVAYYDDGVGTSSFRPLAALGGLFGVGLRRNVLDLYRFLCRNYETGDHIYCFGFSRGAFTARVLAGLIAREGVVANGRDEARLARDSSAAYRRFRRRFNVTGGAVNLLRSVRDWIIARFQDPPTLVPVPEIQFVGVWDTVAAYGGPFEEVTRAIDHWFWPLSMPDRTMSGKIQRACHALALDDERNAFHPVLWDEAEVHGATGKQPMYAGWNAPGPGVPDIDRQRLSQVWFAGMHSDVGGGYAQDGLSYEALQWMIDRAVAYGLRVDPAERMRIARLAANTDKVNDSRRGLVGGYYRYKPRKIEDLLEADVEKPRVRDDLLRMLGRLPSTSAVVPMPPMIHESVFERIGSGADGYAPIVLPAAYRRTTREGAVVDHTDTDRATAQEWAWNWVWGRRVVYFATVLASLFLVALPWINRTWSPGMPPWPAWLSATVQFVGQHLLPEMASTWVGAFAAAPLRFAIGSLVIAVLVWVGGRLERRIDDEMRRTWHPVPGGAPPRDPTTTALYKMRTSRGYRGFFYAMKQWVLPTVFAIAFFVLVCWGIWEAVVYFRA
jgi:uncharacterized protein (DUF2235 family)